MPLTPATTLLAASTTVALPAFLDGQHLVETFGLVGLLAIVFAETGLLIGFFLPGDSLLFSAGFAAAGGIPGVEPPLALVLVLTPLVAIVGAQVGFTIGRKAGPSLFDREDSRFFKKSYVTKADEFIERYGEGKAIVLARFIPIVRTFLNPIAGATDMKASTFFLWNCVGGVLWGGGVTLLGYFLGDIEFIGKNLEVFALLIVAISVLPIAFELLKARSRAKKRV
ncbi:MAG: DedA family protein [Frankiales bacterium]|nr:DedA family protein [Frankiales bacterium]